MRAHTDTVLPQVFYPSFAPTIASIAGSPTNWRSCQNGPTRGFACTADMIHDTDNRLECTPGTGSTHVRPGVLASLRGIAQVSPPRHASTLPWQPQRCRPVEEEETDVHTLSETM